MGLDIRTLSILLGITNILQVIALFIQYRANKTYRGIGWWALGFGAIAIGLVLLLLRDVNSIGLIAIIIGNALTVSAIIFFHIGIMQFLDKTASRWIVVSIFGIFILPFFYYTYVNNDITLRTVIASAALAALSFLTARNLFVNKTRSITASANFISVVFLANGCFFGFRAIANLTVSPVANFFTPTLLQDAAFVEPFIVGILLAFGFIIMVNQRLVVESREAKEHFELIFNTGPDATVISRLHDGLIIDINGGFTSLTGFTRAESIGKSSLEINIWKNPSDRAKVVKELSEKGFCENVEVLLQRKDGSPIPGIMSAKIITLHGSPHIISVTRDITERKRLEDEVQRLAIIAEREKMARDLHDGVAQVLGYVNTQTSAAIEYLARGETAMTNATLAHMRDVTQDAHADLRDFILGVQSGETPVMGFLPTLERYLLQFSTNYQLPVALSKPDEWRDGMLDPVIEAPLLRVIQEALTNTRKHAQAAHARVTLTLTEHTCQVIIADDGCGFTSVPVERRKSGEGGHFGLKIMGERIAEMSGTLDVRSAPGKGTQIIVQVPRATPARVRVSQLRVLIVDDQPLFSDGLRNLLAARGITVVGVAATGEQALAETRRLKPEMVLLDIQMPGMDGLATLAQMKRELPQVKVVMLTASDTPDKLLDALNAGANGYLLKDLNPTEFFDMLEQAMRGDVVIAPKLAARIAQDAARDARAPIEELTPRQKRILTLVAEN
jgi:PAS domain S-box-containing protein